MTSCWLCSKVVNNILRIFFNLPKAATHYGRYSYKVSWSLMIGIQNLFKSPLFCFHGNCGKVCPTDSVFFGLSRSTRCGCCFYQVSSISVWRVTCYDNFCLFNFYIGSHFENSKTWMHLLRWGSTFLWSLVKIGSSVSENWVGQAHSKKMKRNNNNNNNNNKKRCKNNNSEKET